MLLGVGELILITIIMTVLLLPEFYRPQERARTHRLKLYTIVAVLLFTVIILSRTVFRLMIMLAASTLVLIIGFLAVMYYLAHR